MKLGEYGNHQTVGYRHAKLTRGTEMRLKELFDARLNDDDTPMSHDQPIAAVGEADVLVMASTCSRVNRPSIPN